MPRRSIAMLLLAAAAAACAGGEANAPAGIVRVAAGFSPIAEAAGRIGGDRVQVVNLTPPGVEPHDIELTPQQIQVAIEADVVLYIGGGFQPALERVVARRGAGSVDLLSSGEDPHVWLDPVAWRDTVAEIAEALSEADPPGAGAYAANADAYRAELAALDADYGAGLRDCARRLIVTAHEAFGRLAARYRLEQVSIAGISPESEPSPKRLADLRALVRERGVTTIFTEELVSPRVAETLARETGAVTAVLDPIESLDAGPLRSGTTYLSKMLDNLGVLRRGLGCR